MMRAAFVWYKKHERLHLQAALAGSGDWDLTCIHENDVTTIERAFSLVNGPFEVVLVHLSLPNCLALRLAEYVHNTNKRTKLVLFSGTHADPAFLIGLFDGRFDANVDHVELLPGLLQQVVSAPRSPLSPRELVRRVEEVINDDPWLGRTIREAGADRHADRFDYSDYRRAVDAAAGPPANDVFLSYSAQDSEVAAQLREALAQQGVRCFMAERSLQPGEKWENRLRTELRNAREVLILFTRHSIASEWVLTELGAAWALDKPVIPCIRGVSAIELPGPAQTFQARCLESANDVQALSRESAIRLGKVTTQPSSSSGHADNPRR